MKITERLTCRICEKPLLETNTVLDLGHQAIVDFPLPGERDRGSAPLELVLCSECGLLQLRHSVDPETLYSEFFYRSSINEQMCAALKDVVDEATFCVGKLGELNYGDWVCDIGSNDGELLANYPQNVKAVGFEPAKGLALESQTRLPKAIIVNDYFNAVGALGASQGAKYKIVTACAMFYDLDDPGAFLRDVHDILTDDGALVIQMNYLGAMLRNLSFDNVSHEHLCYYSLTTLSKLLEREGFSVAHVEFNDVNGGSIRVYAVKGNQAGDETVAGTLRREVETVSTDAIRNFAFKVEEIRAKLLDFMVALKKSGKKLYAYGASTRGAALLQTVLKGLDPTEYIIAVAERDPHKYGRVMAGLNLPIIPEDVARGDAEYFLLLCYHFWPSVSKRERAWMESGGRFILPVPRCVVSKLETWKSGTFLASEPIEEVPVE